MPFTGHFVDGMQHQETKHRVNNTRSPASQLLLFAGSFKSIQSVSDNHRT